MWIHVDVLPGFFPGEEEYYDTIDNCGNFKRHAELFQFQAFLDVQIEAKFIFISIQITSI
jgi:hypothetical protein